MGRAPAAHSLSPAAEALARKLLRTLPGLPAGEAVRLERRRGEGATAEAARRAS